MAKQFHFYGGSGSYEVFLGTERLGFVALQASGWVGNVVTPPSADWQVDPETGVRFKSCACGMEQQEPLPTRKQAAEAMRTRYLNLWRNR